MTTTNVYLITGFLGAGKTTFLNHFLKYKLNQVNFVIENEFGKVNIDSKLITGKTEKIIELTNGCICCSLDNELVEVLAQISKQEKLPNNIFIETTGIADAGNIINIIKSPLFQKQFSFKTSICIVDAENIKDRLGETIEAAKQISASDIIIINKTDKYLPDNYSSLKQIIKEINPFTEVLMSNDGSVNFEELEYLISNGKAIKIENVSKNSTNAFHKINSVYFETFDLFDLLELKYMLNVNFLIYPNQLFRLKGYINTTPNNKRYLIQSTGNYISFNTVEGVNPKSELVFIGKQLKTETINRILLPAIRNNVKRKSIERSIKSNN